MSTTADKRTLISQLQSGGRRNSAERLRFARQAMEHPDGLVRSVALESLTALRAPELKRALVDGLSDKSWEVRVAALEGLRTVLTPGRQSPAQVRRLLKDSNKLVRLQAAELLGALGDRTVLPHLRASLRDPSPLVRRYVAEALGRIGVSDDRATLRARLKTERSLSAQLGLYHGLYLLGERDVLPELLSLLTSTDYVIRCAAATSLEDTSRDPLDAQNAKRAIREALKTERTPARENMRRTLAVLGRVRM